MSFALEIRLLTGRYAATHYNDRSRAEWPPHPARVYSALVAAHHEQVPGDPEERRALEWLAGAGEPDVFASEAETRRQGEVYVPTNDAAALRGIDAKLEELRDAEAGVAGATGKERTRAEAKLAKLERGIQKRSLDTARADGKGAPANARQLLERRSRQPRTFPVALPTVELVHLRWPREAPTGMAAALDRLAGRVARLGHSSSLVAMRVCAPDIDADGRRHWAPDPDGSLSLRVVSEGQLQRLEEAHARHRQEAPRMLPTSFASYAEQRGAAATEVPAPSLSDDWVIFEVVAAPSGGRRRLLDLSLAEEVARALRGTLLASADGEWPEALSGHAPDGSATQRPHLAFVPLADVGHAHASGSILGAALVPPRSLDQATRRELFRTVAAAERAAGPSGEGDPPPLRLTLGRSGTLYLRRVTDEHPTRALRSRRWCRPARRWLSATAIALERNPGNLRAREPEKAARAAVQAEATVGAACSNAGLPEPTSVWIHPRSLAAGGPAARRFMPFPRRGGGPRRVCVHAELVFDEPVRGPVLVGAGRYYGLGLCVPADER